MGKKRIYRKITAAGNFVVETPQNRRSVLFHCLGLSTFGSALLLQILVFSSIIQHGYFFGVEPNFVVLAFELVLTGFAAAYLFYLFWRMIISRA